jgi:hypothetical protein
MLLSPVLTDAIELFCSKSRVNGFLREAATYSHQLNIVLPLLCRIFQAPMLSDVILGELNRLNKVRNQIVHTGFPEHPLERAETARLLAAAFFGFWYVRMVRSRFKAENMESRGSM